MSERIQTHWEDCWRDPKHHACAVARLEDALAQLADRDKPCVWKRSQFMDFKELRPGCCRHQHDQWDLYDQGDPIPKFCPDCGHPVEVKE